MPKEVKVVNLCSNQLLASGIHEILSRNENIVYYQEPFDQLKTSDIITNADIIIFEDQYMNNPFLLRLMESPHSTLIYLNIHSNKVTVVSKQVLEIEQADDLVSVIMPWKKI